MYLSLSGRHIRWYIIIIIIMHNKYTHTETQRNDGTVSIPVSAGRQAGRRRSFNKAFRALHFGALDEMNESMNEL